MSDSQKHRRRLTEELPLSTGPSFEAPAVDALVRILNPSRTRPIYLPLAGEQVRLSPMASLALDKASLTSGVRELVANGSLVIQP